MMVKWYLGTLGPPDICLTGEEKPRKNLTQETCPDRGSNLGPLRDKRACYHLLHSGGPGKSNKLYCYNALSLILFSQPFHRLATILHLLTFHNTFCLSVQLCTRTCLTVYQLLIFIKMDVYLSYTVQQSLKFVYIWKNNHQKMLHFVL